MRTVIVSPVEQPCELGTIMKLILQIKEQRD